MASMSNIITKLDDQFTHLLSSWNLYTTVLSILIISYVTYILFNWDEPDVHPFLLARQSHASPVRHEGESATYRSLQTPHGYPLRTALDARDPNAWSSSGRKTSDLRGIWNQAAGGVSGEGDGKGVRGKIFTVRGKQEIFEHSFEELSTEINVIGQTIRDMRGQRVATYLPNSIEVLTTVFAAAFYNFTPILLPYDQSLEIIVQILAQTQAEILIAVAGTLSLEEVVSRYQGLKQVIFVVPEGSRHLDWNEVPEEGGGSVGVSVLHELVEEKGASLGAELPQGEDNGDPAAVVTVWQRTKNEVGEIVEFTQANLIAATAALISSIPMQQRFKASDLFLPADPLTSVYPLTLTLAALYSNTSVALNSVAGPGSDLDLCRGVVRPTVMVASAESVASYLQKSRRRVSSGWSNFVHGLHVRTLDTGRMPRSSSTGPTPGKLRLLFVSERAGAACPPLSSADLADLRVLTGARVVYALTAARVAGAVASTNVFDYRREMAPSGRYSHFGAPMSSLEAKLVDTAAHKTTEEGHPAGEITVKGPAVAGGEARLGVAGMIRDDHTLAYA